MSRTYRRDYTGSKAFDRSCRSRGSCPWCERGRLHKHERRAPIVDELDIPYDGRNLRDLPAT